MKSTTDATQVRLRHIRETDLAVFQQLFADPKVMQYSEGLMTNTEVSEWLKAILEQYKRNEPLTVYAIAMSVNSQQISIEATRQDTDDQAIGYCSLHVSPYSGKPEVGYRLLPVYWQRGLATAAVNQLLNVAFSTLKLDEVCAQIDPNNVSSLALAKRVGMCKVGQVKPAHYDYADDLWAITREDFLRK